jgi:tetratricopeptide (TPR) repeat protein
VPGQIAALLRLVEICVDGGLEAVMYEAQAHLADAYLESGQGVEARVIAEDLVAREPWEQAHIDRFRRALVMLDVPDPDALIADRLSGQGPFVATDPFMAGESFNDPEPITPEPVTPPEPPAVEEEAPAPDVPVRVAEPDIPLRPRAAEPDIPLRARAAASEPEPDIPLKPRKADASTSSKGTDIDLTDVLSELEGIGQASAKPAAPPPPSAQNLEAVFSEFRNEVSRQSGASEAAEYLGLGKTYLEMGMTEEAINALVTAARAPAQRFEAASLLGRLYLKTSDLPHAIEWLERAAEAPAPGVSEARELLYELGSILESVGETSRALAVFLELQADAGEYREVAAHVERLTRVQAGG